VLFSGDVYEIGEFLAALQKAVLKELSDRTMLAAAGDQ
jgi:hypothetical protein